ncbi:hypothetical protein K457DRAFT_32574 [Linnemannia elongata AG-77]|uniref:CsbD-like domain-containing protein n=1 Tax=Linnemannia elongata AG-77 TaxID=1314771 RepID=A0A197JXK3_9FUNG|nr:hypothetical protein K457DRAFT_32574 [Linnemannia elongata AG-77]
MLREPQFLSPCITEKIANTMSSYMGSAKQVLGEKLGSPDMVASGVVQKTQADNALREAAAKTHIQGHGHKVEAQAQKKVGSLTGDKTMYAKGEVNDAIGNVQRSI